MSTAPDTTLHQIHPGEHEAIAPVAAATTRTTTTTIDANTVKSSGGNSDGDSGHWEHIPNSNNDNDNDSETYQFPTHLLRPLPPVNNNSSSNSDNGRPVVLVACGSFNPATHLHLRLFESARDYFELEMGRRVVGAYMSPVHDEYGKRKAAGLVPGTHRVHMCRLATSDGGSDKHGSPWVMVDDWEVRQSGFSRTRQVLEHFAQCIAEHYSDGESDLNSSSSSSSSSRNRDHRVQVVLLCGADLLESFVKPGVWRVADVEHILHHYGVATMERDDTTASLNKVVFDHDVLYKHRRNIFIIPQHIQNDISSTKIRAFINRGYSVRYFVPDRVIDYITQNTLFSSRDTN